METPTPTHINLNTNLNTNFKLFLKKPQVFQFQIIFSKETSNALDAAESKPLTRSQKKWAGLKSKVKQSGYVLKNTLLSGR